MERRRLLFVAPLPPPHGGVAVISSQILDSAIGDHYEVESLNLSKPKQKRERINKLSVRSVYYPVILWCRLLARLITFRPHLVYHVTTSDYSFIRDAVMMMTSRFFGAKVICHFHGRRRGLLFGGKSMLMEVVLRLSRFSFHKIIFLTSGLRDSFVSVFGTTKAECVPNFVDLPLFDGEVNRGHDATPAKRVLFLGRTSEAKGIFDVLEATARLRKQGVSLAVDVLGIGETEQEDSQVAEFVTREGIGDVVHFHGIKTGRDKANIMRAAHVFVLPSRAEIFPVSIVEAFACGLPVIVSSVGAVTEIVTDGENGYLVSPGDVDSITQRMNLLLTDEELCRTIGARNRRLAEQRYSKDVVIQKMSDILQSVASCAILVFAVSAAVASLLTTGVVA
jgi:glycosyltransferase involved in cell wall biosynthesis